MPPLNPGARKPRKRIGRGIGSGRKIELDISGPELETILGVAGRAVGKIVAEFPPQTGNQFRPNPGLELGAPEVRVMPIRLGGTKPRSSTFI